MRKVLLLMVLLLSLSGNSQEELSIFDKAFNSKNKELVDEEFKRQECWNKFVQTAFRIEEELSTLKDRGYLITVLNIDYSGNMKNMPIVSIRNPRANYYVTKIGREYVVSSSEPYSKDICYEPSLKRQMASRFLNKNAYLKEEDRYLTEDGSFKTKKDLITYIAMVDRDKINK